MIDPLFMAKALRDNEDEVLRASGWGRDKKGKIYDPLHPDKILPLTRQDIIANSLKIEPYRPRILPDKIQMVASYRRVREGLLEENTIISTFTPKTFLKSLPPLYLYIGSSNAPCQVQILKVEVTPVGSSLKTIRGVLLKETQLQLYLLLRIIEREVIEESCVVSL